MLSEASEKQVRVQLKADAKKFAISSSNSYLFVFLAIDLCNQNKKEYKTSKKNSKKKGLKNLIRLLSN